MLTEFLLSTEMEDMMFARWFHKEDQLAGIKEEDTRVIGGLGVLAADWRLMGDCNRKSVQGL